MKREERTWHSDQMWLIGRHQGVYKALLEVQDSRSMREAVERLEQLLEGLQTDFEARPQGAAGPGCATGRPSATPATRRPARRQSTTRPARPK